MMGYNKGYNKSTMGLHDNKSNNDEMGYGGYNKSTMGLHDNKSNNDEMGYGGYMI